MNSPTVENVRISKHLKSKHPGVRSIIASGEVGGKTVSMLFNYSESISDERILGEAKKEIEHELKNSH